MRQIIRLVLPIVLVIATVAIPGIAAAQDPIWVQTFRNEFVNWATPHVDSFTFPEAQLYEQITCHVTLACPSAPGDCDPWDRFANLSIRHFINETDYIDYEIVRFITPYDITFGGGPQACAWTIDVTDYQFLLTDDVTLVLYIDSWIGGDRGWLMTFNFEMVPGVPEREAFAIQQLWRRGHVVYGDPDNPVETQIAPVDVDVPGGATWAKFRAFSTGHGFLNTDNAAEFSYKWQRVFVGTEMANHYLWRPDCESNPCAPQLGTWQYDRAGWCPGDKAEAWDVEISDWVTPGGTEQIRFLLQPYENWCRPNNPDCVDTPNCECPGHAYYRIEGQVVFYRQPNPTAAEDGRQVPGLLHLVGNHPNPFNPSTTIKYHLAAAGAVEIAVYDAEGALVRLESLDHEAGTHAWTGRRRALAAGRRLPVRGAPRHRARRCQDVDAQIKRTSSR